METIKELQSVEPVQSLVDNMVPEFQRYYNSGSINPVAKYQYGSSWKATIDNWIITPDKIAKFHPEHQLKLTRYLADAEVILNLVGNSLKEHLQRTVKTGGNSTKDKTEISQEIYNICLNAVKDIDDGHTKSHASEYFKSRLIEIRTSIEEDILELEQVSS